MDAETGLETKVISGEGADDMLLAFEAFKEANDERLGADRKAHGRRRGDNRKG